VQDLLVATEKQAMGSTAIADGKPRVLAQDRK
jgi:hypothetical protein